MPVLPDDITFEQWVAYVFDHPVLKHAWWFHNEDSPHHAWWDEEAAPEVTLDFLTRLFSDPAFLIGRYTAPQVDQALNFLVSNSCSNHMFTLTNTALPWPDRARCLDAMGTLFAQLAAPVYGDRLGHTVTETDRRFPCDACYMWWDVIPLYAGMDHPDRDGIHEHVIGIFRATIALESEACVESALHGLGHWLLDLPGPCRSIINTFLQQRRDVSDALRTYASQAATGMIL